MTLRSVHPPPPADDYRSLLPITWIPLISLTLLAGFAPAASAQEFGRVGSMATSGMSYRTFVYPGEGSIQVLVFGTGGSSGIYEVGTSTTLEQLLALSGVTGEGTTGYQRNRTTIRLQRENAGRRSMIYESRLSDLLRNPERHPELREGDVIEIETRSSPRFTWREGLQVISAAGSVLWLIDGVRRLR